MHPGPVNRGVELSGDVVDSPQSLILEQVAGKKIQDSFAEKIFKPLQLTQTWWPVGDALLIAFYKLAQGAAQDLKVVLGGEGADAAFARPPS